MGDLHTNLLLGRRLQRRFIVVTLRPDPGELLLARDLGHAAQASALNGRYLIVSSLLV